MKTNVDKLGVILLLSQACLLTVLCAEDLTEQEMLELDIFKMDEKYDKIYRIKRTDDTEDVDGSGDGDPFQAYSNSTGNSDTNPNEAPIDNHENPPPDSQLNSSSDTATPESTDNLASPESVTEAQPVESTDNSLDESENITQTDATNVETTLSEDIPQATEDTQAPPIPIVPPTINVNTTGQDTSVVESENKTHTDATNARANTPEDIPKAPEETQAPPIPIVPPTNNASTTGQDPNSNKTATDKQENPKNDSQPNNSAKAATPPVRQNPPTTAAPESTKPTVGESGKSNVSGSGVLFTIIILAVVAALGGFGYFMYKRRKTQYDPVAAEDVEKEMTEVRSENGYFGKPIKDEEVKLEDQMTPLHPQPAPRSFSPDSPEDDDLVKVEVVKEDADRQKREQSVEFEEEKKKGDEQQ